MDRIELVRKLMKSGKEEDKAILSLLVDTFKFEQVTYKMSEFIVAPFCAPRPTRSG